MAAPEGRPLCRRRAVGRWWRWGGWVCGCQHMHSTDAGADGTATQGDKAPASLLKKPVAKRNGNDLNDSDDDEFYDRTASRAKVPHSPALPPPLLLGKCLHPSCRVHVARWASQ
jgi:hypothetical protein